MKLDIFCEVEKAGELDRDSEHRLFEETLAQAELADRMGFGCWWEVEHHCAGEMSYSSAPECMLAAIAQRTRQIRIGHSVVLAPFSHAIRIAERASTIDHLSNGRLELGFGRSTIPEWRLMGIKPDEAQPITQETMEMVPKMFTQDAFSWKSPRYEINGARVRPRPYQRPHPPLWMSASTEASFKTAARNGVGVLGVTLLTQVESMAAMIASYREGIKTAQPVGSFVNDQTAVFTFVHCAETTSKAVRNGAAEACAWYINTMVRFFELHETMKAMQAGSVPAPDTGGTGFAGRVSSEAPNKSEAMALIGRLGRGEQTSGEEVYEVLGKHDSIIIGDPKSCRKKMERYREIGVDRLMCFQQVGALKHEDIMQSIRLIGENIVPEFSTH
jgi:alkanesulfonate monooxygenase SsuD/methylene tetrahydromethanopterin reductase-like flavin-dependent oxidoreductase (luciferase family)